MKALYFTILPACLLLFSCKKQLDVKPSASLSIPTTVEQYQGLLDNTQQFSTNDPSAAETSADDYYLLPANYNSASETNRRLYTWQRSNIFLLSPTINEWATWYKLINMSDIVLSGIEKVDRNSGNAAVWDNVKGQALFSRGRVFFNIAQVWAQSYDSATAAADLGIPLRLISDFNLQSSRATLRETYQQIISDLQTSIHYLPTTPMHVIRPSKPAVYGLLARVYLYMRDYTRAGIYADSSLQYNSGLLDYNSIGNTPVYPFTQFNAEVVMHSVSPGGPLISVTAARIDSNVYRSYAANDLRKSLFFKSNGDGTFSYRGSYDGNINFFDGIATDEMYLIRAECRARAGNTNTAMADLNTLLVKRWKAGTYVAATASSVADAVAKIIAERRKELLMRLLRWGDVKRLNKEGANIGRSAADNRTIYCMVQCLPITFAFDPLTCNIIFEGRHKRYFRATKLTIDRFQKCQIYPPTSVQIAGCDGAHV